MTVVLTKIFSVIVAVAAFITNTFGGIIPSRPGRVVELPDSAIELEYGKNPCENLVLFLPEDKSEPVDILLCIHGGAWMGGDEKEFAENCRAASEECGYAAASMDYGKFTNGANAFTMIDEIELAILKIKAEMESRGYTADKLILAGHSAGAHLALMYSYTRHDTSPVEIAFVVSNCAPAEFLKDSRAKTTTMGKYAFLVLTALSSQAVTPFNENEQADVIKSVSPVHLVDSSVPPTIVVQGNADKMVPYQNAIDLYAALQANGVPCKMITYEGAGHFLGSEFEKENEQRSAAFAEFAERYA